MNEMINVMIIDKMKIRGTQLKLTDSKALIAKLKRNDASRAAFAAVTIVRDSVFIF